MKKITKNFLFWLNIGFFVILSFQTINLVMGQTAGPPGDAGQILRVGSGGKLFIDQTEANRVVIANEDANTDLIFDLTRNLGIDDYNPAKKLSVNGTIEGTVIYAINGFVGDISARHVTSDVFGNGTGNFAFPVNLGVGYGSTASLPAGLSVSSTIEQLRLSYNQTNYASFTVASNGQLTLASSNNATTTISNPVIFSRFVSLSNITNPGVSVSGQGRIYFNGTKFQVSEDGRTYVDLVSAASANYWVNTGTHLYSSSTTWNVMIGTSTPSSPSAKLEVLNTGDDILRLWRLNSSYNKIVSTTFRVGEDSAFVIQNQSNDVLTIKNSNVGIGTSTPERRLTVVNPLTEAIVALSGTNMAYTSIAVGRTQPEARFYIVDASGRPFIDPQINIPNDAVIKIDDPTRRIHFAAGSAPVLSVGSDTVTVGTTTVYTGGKLQVNGLFYLIGQNLPTDPSGANGMIYFNSFSGKFRCYQDGAWTNCIGSSGTNYWTLNSSSLYPSDTAYRVGVGLFTPDANYKITTDGGGIKLKGSTTGSTNYALYAENSMATALGWIRNDGTVYLAGNVGIGTLSPEQALHINKSNSGLFLSTNQHDAGSASIFFGGNGHINDTWMRINYDGSTFGLNIDKNIGADGGGVPSWTNLVKIDFGGNVGIGITGDPTAKLDVNGFVKMSGFSLTTGAGSGKVLTSNAQGIGTWQSAGGYWTQSGSDLYPNNTAWNVGIGTTAAPTGKLEVASLLSSATPSINLVALNVTDAPWIRLTTAGLNVGEIRNDMGFEFQSLLPGNGIKFIADDGNIGFYPNGIERVRITSAGDVVFSGTITNDPAMIVFKGYEGIEKGRLFAWPTSQPTDNRGIFMAASGVTTPQFGVYDGGYVGINLGFASAPTERLEVSGNIKATGLIANSATIGGSAVCRADGNGCPASQAIARTQCPPRRVVISYIDVAGEVEYLMHNGCVINYGSVLLSNVAVYKGDTLKGYIKEGTGSVACFEFGFARAIEGGIVSATNACPFSGGQWQTCGSGNKVGSLTCFIE